tara:strand:- start:298 stop:852 length:555 start_codon:yes stop_codon:yes gene_type:complete
MSNLAETITNEKEKLVLRIYYDETTSLHHWLDEEGPQIYYKHRRYSLGQHELDPMGFGSEEELIQWLKDEKGAKTVKKLYAHEHGSITVKAGDTNPFTCPWDSGQVGFVTSHKKDDDENIHALIRIVDMCLQSQVYYLTVSKLQENGEEEEIDSCGGVLDDTYYQGCEDFAESEMGWIPLPKKG